MITTSCDKTFFIPSSFRLQRKDWKIVWKVFFVLSSKISTPSSTLPLHRWWTWSEDEDFLNLCGGKQLLRPPHWSCNASSFVLYFSLVSSWRWFWVWLLSRFQREFFGVSCDSETYWQRRLMTRWIVPLFLSLRGQTTRWGPRWPGRAWASCPASPSFGASSFSQRQVTRPPQEGDLVVSGLTSDLLVISHQL